MARWRPSLHPRDSQGRFRSKGGSSGRRKRLANRTRAVGSVIRSEAVGGAVGYGFGGPVGAVVGATLAGRAALRTNANRIRTGR